MDGLSHKPAARALVLIDVRCTSLLPDRLAGIVEGASQVTVVALPWQSRLWRYAPLGGHASLDDMRRTAQLEAVRLLRRVVDQMPAECTVEHRVLPGWRDVVSLLHERAFQVAVLAVPPGRRARRAIAAASRAAGTALVDSTDHDQPPRMAHP